jgi:hypothetical protein
VKTPNDPTTIASARERFAGVDEPTATDQTLAAWILAKDYERIRQERDELRAACELLVRSEDADDYGAACVLYADAVSAARDALSKGADQ